LRTIAPEIHVILGGDVVTGAQLYLAISLPTLSVLSGILVNCSQFGALNARITNLENKFDTRFDLLLSKVIDIDNRLTRLEAQRH